VALILLANAKFSITSAHCEQDYDKWLTCTAGCSLGAQQDFHKLLTSSLGLSQIFTSTAGLSQSAHLYRRTLTNDSAVPQDSHKWLSCTAGLSQKTHQYRRTLKIDSLVLQDSHKWLTCTAGLSQMTPLFQQQWILRQARVQHRSLQRRGSLIYICLQNRNIMCFYLQQTRMLMYMGRISLTFASIRVHIVHIWTRNPFFLNCCLNIQDVELTAWTTRSRNDTTGAVLHVYAYFPDYTIIFEGMSAIIWYFRKYSSRDLSVQSICQRFLKKGQKMGSAICCPLWQVGTAQGIIWKFSLPFPPC